MEDVYDKKVFVLGMGISGTSCVKELCKNNHVLLTDIKCDDLNLIKD